MHEKLIGRQMRRWELDQRLRERFQRDEAEGKPSALVITVSRQWGSGGTTIAKLVAQQLDFQLYDREIIDRVAELAGAEPRQIADHDERDTDIVGELVLQLLEGKRPTEGVYLRALVRTVREIAEQGRAVIVGRGAWLILQHSFRVRIVAPEPIRVARIAELHNMEERRARRMILETDRQRQRFIRSLFGANIDDCLGYDLVINTEHCSLDHAAALIVKGFANRCEGTEFECYLPTS